MNNTSFFTRTAGLMAGALLTFFGFMHGESVGIAVTPAVAGAYAAVAVLLFGLSRYPVTMEIPLAPEATTAPAE